MFLLSNRFKLPGWCLAGIGSIAAVCYLVLDFQIVIPVFAIFSSFLETKVFTILRTNFADEMIMLTLLAGLFLVVFSKEKEETPELNLTRAKAWSMALGTNSILLFISILFIYGTGFFAILVLNLYSVFIFYLFIFYRLKWKTDKEHKGLA